MSARVYIEKERLVLRDWREEDAAPFATMNADPRVMEFFLRPLTRPESDAAVARMRAFIRDHDYGLFAAEEKRSGAFLGFVGLSPVPFEAPFTPATEIGWRLARTAWGSGYATEGRVPFSAMRLKGSNSWSWCHSPPNGTHAPGASWKRSACGMIQPAAFCTPPYRPSTNSRAMCSIG